jgi:hypothetical protein
MAFAIPENGVAIKVYCKICSFRRILPHFSHQMDDLSNFGLPPDIQQFATGMQASDLLERASNFASLLESMVLCRVIQLLDFVNIVSYFQKVQSFARGFRFLIL